MKITMARAAGCAALFAGAAALLLILTDAAFAQIQGGGDITAGAQRAYQWLINLLRVLAAFIVMGGFAMFSAGRFPWTGGIVMVVGILGMLNAQGIVQYFAGA